jgi:hypothetical protein
MKKLILLIIFAPIINVEAEVNLKEISDVLKQVETLGNTKSIGDGGKAYGVLQIHKIYVDEVNNRYGTAYTHKQMFDPICAEEVFLLCMQFAQERFCKKYNRMPTEEEIVRMHNGGIYTGYKKKSTIKYYKRYLKFKNKMKK